MVALRLQLQALAESLASDVLDVLRNAPLKDLVLESRVRGRGAPKNAPAPERGAVRNVNDVGGGPAGRKRMTRRSPEQMLRTVDELVALATRNEPGLRAEQIRQLLGL